MAQAYLSDSGLLFLDDPNKTELEIEAEPWFDADIMLTSNVSDEVFNADLVYFYVQSLDWYFSGQYGLHPYLFAARGLFVEERWQVIRILIDQFGLSETLNQFDFEHYAEVLNYLETQSLITSAESASLMSVLPL